MTVNWESLAITEQERAYSTAYAEHAPRYRTIWRNRDVKECRGALRDIHETLAIHSGPSEYTGKLWAELDAIRDRVIILQRKGE